MVETAKDNLTENSGCGVHQADKDESITLPLKPYKCLSPKCAKVLGYTDGVYLHIGQASFPFTITFACGYCGSVCKWVPALKSRNEIRKAHAKKTLC